MRKSRITWLERAADKKKQIKVHCDNIIKQTNSFCTKMQQEVDAAITEVAKQYEKLQSVLAEEMFQLKEAMNIIKAYQIYSHINSYGRKYRVGSKFRR